MATEAPKRPGRPAGAKDKHPRNNKITELMSSEQIRNAKHKIIELFDARKVDNLSQAADIMNLSKMRLYSWKYRDPDWAKMLAQAEQLVADELEAKLNFVKNVPECTAIIFRLKKIRPEYRDTWKFGIIDSKVIEHLEKLQELAKQEPKKEPAENK